MAPLQLVIDRHENGEIFIESKANAADNPTTFRRQALKTPLLLDKKEHIGIGRLTVKLTYGQENLSKTIQLRPAGLLGLMTVPVIAIDLILALFAVTIYDLHLKQH